MLLAPLCAVACSGPDEILPDAGGGGTDAMEEDPADAMVTPMITDGPTFTVGPNASAPLAGLLEVSTNVPTTVFVTVTDGTDTFELDFTEAAMDHALPILGLHPDTTYTVTMTATTLDDVELSASPLMGTTDPLPDNFPIITVETSDPPSMEPGVTLLCISDFLVILDSAGDVVWFYDSTTRSPQDCRRTPAGTFVFNQRDANAIDEVDVLGNVLNRWYPTELFTDAPLEGSIPVAIDTMHHEVFPLASGSFLTMSTELRGFDNYPTSEEDPTPQATPQNVIGDVIVQFAPNGDVEMTRRLLDILDPYRLGYDSFGAFWDEDYADEGGGIDWSHGNAVVHDPDGGMVISLRHQDALVKLDDAGELMWILAPPANWTSEFQSYLLAPQGSPFAYTYHQHAPEILPDGNILVFDNGNYRASPPDTPQTEYSRAVEFDIDETAMTVTQVWEYDAGEALFAPFLGDTDRMSTTNNTLITFGGQVQRVQEVTGDDPAVVVFELSASESIYRSERLPSLYP